MQIPTTLLPNSFITSGAHRLHHFLFDELFQLFSNLLTHVLLDRVRSECFPYIKVLVIVVHASSSSAARLGGSFGFSSKCWMMTLFSLFYQTQDTTHGAGRQHFTN